MHRKTHILLILVLSAVAACNNTPSPATSLQRYEFAQAQMGLEFRVTLYAENEHRATNAVTQAFARIAELNAILSDYDSDSEISRLSRSSGTDQWVRVGDDLWTIIYRSQELARESNGAFDLTIGPSVNLWRRARRRSELPTAELLSAMHERVGHEFLVLQESDRSVRLIKPDMRLDAGGIAKGFAMDEAMKTLRQHGIQSAMIHGGGDMVFGDPPPDRSGWIVQLTQPSTNAIVIANAALATSGDLEQFLEIKGVRYSHIIDPRTGIGLTNRSLVHVIAPDGITADSLSTTLNILDENDAKELLRRHPGVEASRMTINEEGASSFQTDGFRTYYVEQ